MMEVKVDAIWVRRLRERLGYTQRECAELVGVEARTWKRWESGSPLPASMRKLLHLMFDDPEVVVHLEHLREQEQASDQDEPC